MIKWSKKKKKRRSSHFLLSYKDRHILKEENFFFFVFFCIIYEIFSIVRTIILYWWEQKFPFSFVSLFAIEGITWKSIDLTFSNAIWFVCEEINEIMKNLCRLCQWIERLIEGSTRTCMLTRTSTCNSSSWKFPSFLSLLYCLLSLSLGILFSYSSRFFSLVEL